MLHEHYIIPFGTELWWVGLIGFFFISIMILLLGKHLFKSGKEPIYRRILFWILLIREMVFYAYTIYLGQFTLQDSLPLHLCNISYIGLLIFLYNPNAFIFEFLILLGIGGALQSILTPELTHGYSPYLYADYYLSHSAIIFTPLYAYFVLGMRPRPYSWLTIWIAAHIVLGVVGIINWFLNSNYIYLCQAPKVDNPMVTGQYPLHLLGFEIFGTLHILFFYFIFKSRSSKVE